MEDSPNLFEKLPPRRANTLPSSFRLESVRRPIRISINNIARLPSPDLPSAFKKAWLAVGARSLGRRSSLKTPQTTQILRRRRMSGGEGAR